MTGLQRLQRQYRRDMRRARLLGGDDAAEDVHAEWSSDPDDDHATIGERYPRGQSSR